MRQRRLWLVLGGSAFVFVALMLLTPLNPLALLPGEDSGEFFASSEPQVIDNPRAPLASFYDPAVLYWREALNRWALEYSLNPNVLAIVMQIESCGNPQALSWVGAVGLMQVMPFHFENGENQLNPNTNVARGMGVFYECLTVFSGWDLGLALACYNGGPSVTVTDSAYWPQETQFYYEWATSLWEEVVDGEDESPTLTTWLENGGDSLCQDAAQILFPSESGS